LPAAELRQEDANHDAGLPACRDGLAEPRFDAHQEVVLHLLAAQLAGDARVLGGEHQRPAAAGQSAGRRGDAADVVGLAALGALVPAAVLGAPAWRALLAVL